MPSRKGLAYTSQKRENAARPMNAVAFVSYHGPHRKVSPAARKLVRQQAMKEIGKSRRKQKHEKFVDLDLSLLQSTGTSLTPASWWLGVRWTATDDLNLIASFKVELNSLEKGLIANSEQVCNSQHDIDHGLYGST